MTGFLGVWWRWGEGEMIQRHHCRGVVWCGLVNKYFIKDIICDEKLYLLKIMQSGKKFGIFLCRTNYCKIRLRLIELMSFN